ncbi:MAG: hypothetical protein ABIQ35_11380, partial [Verrucomicrobiota bacterium]
LSGGIREEIARELRGLKLEYYDGYDWYDDWGQLEPQKKQKDPALELPNVSGLPEAVRITLSFDPNPGKRRAAEDSEASTLEPALVFQTVVRLELTGRSDETSNAKEGEAKSSTSENRARPSN